MTVQRYNPDQIEIAKKFLSPDAFMYIVGDAIARGQGLSAAGFGDGERSVMIDNGAHYLSDEKYLTEYGLAGADLGKVRKNLFKAASEADFFCPLVHGIYMEAYDCIRLSRRRDIYVERLFPYSWHHMDHRERVLFQVPVAVVCRNAATTAANLQTKYMPPVPIQFIEYGSWQDYDRALEEIKNTSVSLVLCAVGQSGKYMIVEAARENKVVLDIGSALINKWQHK